MIPHSAANDRPVAHRDDEERESQRRKHAARLLAGNRQQDDQYQADHRLQDSVRRHPGSSTPSAGPAREASRRRVRQPTTGRACAYDFLLFSSASPLWNDTSPILPRNRGRCPSYGPSPRRSGFGRAGGPKGKGCSQVASDSNVGIRSISRMLQCEKAATCSALSARHRHRTRRKPALPRPPPYRRCPRNIIRNWNRLTKSR